MLQSSIILSAVETKVIISADNIFTDGPCVFGKARIIDRNLFKSVTCIMFGENACYRLFIMRWDDGDQTLRFC